MNPRRRRVNRLRRQRRKSVQRWRSWAIEFLDLLTRTPIVRFTVNPAGRRQP